MIQCCIAANAPWPRPPKASEHCFVVSISTKRRLCGMSLHILHKSHDDTISLPIPLAQTAGLTKGDYDNQIKQLQVCLEQWKGGYADAFLTTWAFLVIVLFVVGYLTPSFWFSGFHEHPFWIFLLMMSHFCGFYALWRYIGYENQALIHKIEQDMRLWHGIRVTMKRVAYLPHQLTNEAMKSGMYCFCVSMQGSAADGDDEATLAVSNDDSEDEASV